MILKQLIVRAILTSIAVFTTPMLKSILSNYLISQDQTFDFFGCTLTGNNIEHWKNSTNCARQKDGTLKQPALIEEYHTSPEKSTEDKTVRFNPSLEHDAASEGKFPNKRPQPPSKRKAKIKDSKGGNGDSNTKDAIKELNGDQCHGYWDHSLTKWAARLDYLAEAGNNALKCIRAQPPLGSTVHFDDSQAHLRIGSGPDFSSIFLGILDGSTEVAVKKINVKRAPLLLDQARQQSLVALVSASSLAKVHLITRDKTQFYIVRELCENSLKHEFKMRRYIPKSIRPPLDCIGLCKNIAKSVAVLHAKQWAHMALKPENIFLTKTGEIKLADYGIHQRNISKKQQYENGTVSLCWLPSEAHSNESSNLTQASDIASLGMVFFWVITGGSHPFGDLESADACAKNILHGHYNLKPIEDPFAHHLVQHMIFKEPEKRLSISQVLEHPCFWTTEQKVEYVKLLAKAIHLILGTNSSSNTMSNSLMHLLKSKERCILHSLSEATDLKIFPKEARTNLSMLLAHADRCIQNNINGADIPGVLLKNYPGIILEMHAKFSDEDLENIIADLTYIRNNNIPDHHYMLQPCLSSDSGIGSSGTEPVDIPDDFERYDITTFPFETCSKRNREDSACYASTDDGIDVLSPVCGSLTGESVFSSPVKITQSEFKDKWRTSNPSLMFSPESYCSSVDNHFDFDGIDFWMEKSPPQPSFGISVATCTDMDKLD